MSRNLCNPQNNSMAWVHFSQFLYNQGICRMEKGNTRSHSYHILELGYGTERSDSRVHALTNSSTATRRQASQTAGDKRYGGLTKSGGFEEIVQDG